MRARKPVGIDRIVTKRHVQDDKTPSQFIETPVGLRYHRPGWTETLAKCETDEDLFALVRQNNFIDPDALSEVLHRGLYWDYEEWVHRDEPPAPTMMDILRKAYGLDEED